MYSATYRFAINEYNEARKGLAPRGPSEPEVWKRYEEARDTLFILFIQALENANEGDELEGIEGSMFYAGIDRYGRRVVTQDGLFAYSTEWHEGPSDDTVYYETYKDGKRCSHGYVDAISRHLVQSG